MTVRPWMAFLALAAATAASAPGAAQEARSDTLARVAGRALEELVAALPGEVMTLQEVVAVALERNLDLEAAATLEQRADADLRVQQGLFDPTLSLGWVLARDRADPARSGTYVAALQQALPWGTQLGIDVQGTRSPIVAGGGQPPYGADAALTLRQPLLEGLGTLDAGVREARALRRATAATLARAREVVVADVETAYWTLAEAEATQAVLQHSVDIAEALLFRNQQLADRQLVPEVDVLTARGAVALRRAAFISARQAREDAAERLVFLAWGAGAPARLAASVLPLKTVGTHGVPLPAPDSLDQAVTAALAARQDVAAARATLDAAEETRRAARRGVLPSLELSGALSSAAAGASLGGSFGSLGGRPSWSLGLAFSQPLLNRRARGVDAQADLTTTLRRLDVAIAENNVSMEVRAAHRALVAGTERVAAADEAASLSAAQLEAERRRLDLGLGDSFRLLQTEEIAAQSQLESVRARFDLARAATAYRLAVGGGRTP